MNTMTADEMRALDTHLAGTSLQAERVKSRIAAKWNEMHRAAGDKRRYEGRRPVWGMDEHAVRAELAARPAGAALTAGLAALQAELSPLLAEIDRIDAVYRQAPWARYYECGNADGHIHSSLRGCSTVRWDTPMGWCPELSARTEAEAVAQLGPHLCTVCFPTAPVGWRRSKAETTREANAPALAARKAAKAAQDAIKNLTPGEWFEDESGSTVKTVHGAKFVIREAAEMRHFRGVDQPGRFYAGYQAAADRARVALLAHGLTEDEVSKIEANADKNQRREAAKFSKAS